MHRANLFDGTVVFSLV